MFGGGLSRITIVIPTFGRPRFLMRQFAYWKNSDAKVVILDGSPTPVSIPPTMMSSNIRYVHSGGSFPTRIVSAGEYVSTPYCAMLSDDEFFTFSGLRASLSRLDTDPTIVGCVGRCQYFFVDQQRFLLKDAYREWKPFSPDAVTQSLRLDEDLPPNKTHMAHYAVMRSNVWKDVMLNAYGQTFSCAYSYERLVNLRRTILGRTEILEDLLWFRSMENRNITTSTASGPNFLAWVRSPEYSGEIGEYRRIATRLLVEGGVDPLEAKEFEHRWFSVGVDQTILRKSKLRKRFRDWYRQKLLVWSPKWFRLFVKRHLPNRLLEFSGWQGYGLDEMCDSLASRGTRFDREEIELIMELSLATARDLTADTNQSNAQ